MGKVPFCIDRAVPGTLTGKVERELRDRIADGSLRPGDRLPSRDALAKALGVSEFVVRRAFAELVADKLIAGRPRIGHVVLDGGTVSRERLVLDVSTENFGSFASRVSTVRAPGDRRTAKRAFRHLRHRNPHQRCEHRNQCNAGWIHVHGLVSGEQQPRQPEQFHLWKGTEWERAHAVQ